MDMSSNGCKKTRRETRGRPRKLNKRQERKLRRSIQILREQEGNFTIKRLMENACICRKDVSEGTISRFLNKEGLIIIYKLGRKVC
jgi:transposase